MATSVFRPFPSTVSPPAGQSLKYAHFGESDSVPRLLWKLNASPVRRDVCHLHFTVGEPQLENNMGPAGLAGQTEMVHLRMQLA